MPQGQPPRSPRIAVTLVHPVPVRTLGYLHRFTGQSLAEVRRLIDEGQPVLELDIFSREGEALHDPRVQFDRIRELLDEAERFGCAVHYYGLEADEELNEVDLRLVELRPEAIRRRLTIEEENLDAERGRC